MWYNDTIRPRDACLITAATQVHCFHFELLMCIYNTTTWISISFDFHWVWFMLSASEKASKVAYFECHLSQSNHNNSNSRTTFDFKLNNIFVCLFMYRSINFLSLVRALVRSLASIFHSNSSSDKYDKTHKHIFVYECVLDEYSDRKSLVSSKLKI